MDHVLLTVALLALLAAAVRDVAARTIPHAACATLAAVGLGLRFAEGTALAALAAALLVLAAGIALWHVGCWGGGDAKLLAAAALAVPPSGVPGLLLATALAGGALAAGYLFAARLAAAAPPLAPAPRGTGLLRRALRAERHRLRRRGPLPYGVAIAAGAAFSLLASVTITP